MDIEKATSIVATLCIKFEGFRSHPYLCSAGVATVGFGATFYEDGRKVSLNDPPISRERAIQLLHFHIRRHFLPKTVRLCPGADTPARVAALCDFAFNLGHGALAASTLRRRVNAGEWDDVPAQLRRWNKAGGRVLRGLVRRRDAEAGLI